MNQNKLKTKWLGSLQTVFFDTLGSLFVMIRLVNANFLVLRCFPLPMTTSENCFGLIFKSLKNSKKIQKFEFPLPFSLMSESPEKEHPGEATDQDYINTDEV